MKNTINNIKNRLQDFGKAIKAKARPIEAFIYRHYRLTTTGVAALVLGTAAHAQAVNTNQLVRLVCSVIGPFVGGGQMLSLVFIVVLAVFAFLLWMNESKEGPVIWVLRTGTILSVLVNIFTLPPLFGMAPITC